jgi:hypothetical protein
LDLLEQLDHDPRLGSYHCCRRRRLTTTSPRGRREEAAAAYRKALTLVDAAGERRFCNIDCMRCSASPTPHNRARIAVASVATKFSTPKMPVLLICVSMLLLAVAFIRMLTLPLRL